MGSCLELEAVVEAAHTHVFHGAGSLLGGRDDPQNRKSRHHIKITTEYKTKALSSTPNQTDPQTMQSRAFSQNQSPSQDGEEAEKGPVYRRATVYDAVAGIPYNIPPILTSPF